MSKARTRGNLSTLAWGPGPLDPSPKAEVRYVAVMKRLLVGLIALCTTACIIEDHHYSPPPPSDTRLEFDEVTNLGYACGGPLTAWTVTNRQTGDVGNAGCEQPVLFIGLAPNASYTFDVVGYSGQRLC